MHSSISLNSSMTTAELANLGGEHQAAFLACKPRSRSRHDWASTHPRSSVRVTTFRVGHTYFIVTFRFYSRAGVIKKTNHRHDDETRNQEIPLQSTPTFDESKTTGVRRPTAEKGRDRERFTRP
jgi:hypothetical protein